MNCPNCGKKLIVADVRTRPGSNSIYRRRKCLACGTMMKTFEYPEDMMTEIIMKRAIKAKKQLGKKIVKMIKEELDVSDRPGQNRLDNVSG